ncbi:MAG: acyl-CoA thioesterase [Planctomycetes bacterium]|nr:acyl-CoA thioesterase [Planctomycetota bacterium]
MGEWSHHPAIRVILLPRDTNERGTIFGGVLLSLIDQAGGIECHRHGDHKYVTVAMKEVVFHKPVYVGDLVSLYTTTKRVGTTSVSVGVRVEAVRRAVPHDRVRVTEAEAVYVAVDDKGHPIPVKAS